MTITLTQPELEALVRNIDDPDGFVRSVELSRRDSLDNLMTDGTGFLVLSILTGDGEQQRVAISETGSTSIWS